MNAVNPRVSSCTSRSRNRCSSRSSSVSVGTDSLASAPTLNLFDELHEMRRLAPDVTAAALLHSATRQGAVALGFGAAYGSIETGRRAELLAVDIPAGVTDVEEYLVSGLPPGAVRWAVP